MKMLRLPFILTLFLFISSVTTTHAQFTNSITLRGAELSAVDLSRAYNKIKKKYGFHPQLKTVMPAKHRDMRKRKPTWHEGNVVQTKGNVVIVQQAGAILAFATTRTTTLNTDDTIELLAWEKGKYSYQPPDASQPRSSIPLMTDVTITPTEFIKQITSGYKFKTIDWFYNLLSSGGDITQTKQKLYAQEQAGHARNLLKNATLSLTRGSNTMDRTLALIHNGSASSSKSKCWNSEKQLPQQLYFTWDTFNRAGKFIIHSGYKKKGAKSYQNIIKECSLEYFDVTEWRPVPGGQISQNTEHKLALHIHPVKFKELRLTVQFAPQGYASISEIEIQPWDMKKRPAPPVSIGAKRFTEAQLLNAYERVKRNYGLRTNGVNPIPFSELREGADKGKPVYRYEGQVTDISGNLELRIGAKGWVKFREPHSFKVGDEVSLIIQKSPIKKMMSRPGEKLKVKERIYLDLTMHYSAFIRALQQQYKFTELESLLAPTP